MCVESTLPLIRIVVPFFDELRLLNNVNVSIKERLQLLNQSAHCLSVFNNGAYQQQRQADNIRNIL